MILESAFVKLPELLTRNFGHEETFEATIQHLFAVAAHMELDSRNIPRAFELVTTERPYPNKRPDGRPIHADVWLGLEGVVADPERMVLYGWRPDNWVEIKAYLSASRGGSSPPKTANVGRVLADLLRLCLLPKEQVGQTHLNGRYLLLVADRPIESYLAFSRGTRSRVWLEDLFSDGVHSVDVDVSNEPKSLWSPIIPGAEPPDLRMRLEVNTLAFRPMRHHPNAIGWAPLFWGFLVNILAFKITYSGNSTEYDATSSIGWDLSGGKYWQGWDRQGFCQLATMRRQIMQAMSLAKS